MEKRSYNWAIGDVQKTYNTVHALTVFLVAGRELPDEIRMELSAFETQMRRFTAWVESLPDEEKTKGRTGKELCEAWDRFDPSKAEAPAPEDEATFLAVLGISAY